MDINIDCESITTYTGQMEQIASDVRNIERSINYYYYGSIKSEGSYASAYGKMRSTLQNIANDMSSFMAGFAGICSGITQSLDTLDAEINVFLQENNLS